MKQNNVSHSVEETPVLFAVFNRPAMTQQVFETIRKAKPAKLFIAADGPRKDRPGEAAKCNQVRDIATAVDWPCEVQTLFRDENLGCGVAVSQAISWFFSHVEGGIILEDDCVPSQDFFRFCAELLVRYKHDTRIMQIGGNNLLPMASRDEEYSYFFSNHNYIWGWATWRRAWDHYNYKMEHYEEVMKKNYHDDYLYSVDEQNYFDYVYEQTYYDNSSRSSWDYQWQFTRMLQSGLTIVPTKNLVINLGYGDDDATHTVNDHWLIDSLILEPMRFPLKHPEFVLVDREQDSEVFRRLSTTPMSRAKQRIKKVMPKILVNTGKKLMKLIP